VTGGRKHKPKVRSLIANGTVEFVAACHLDKTIQNGIGFEGRFIGRRECANA